MEIFMLGHVPAWLSGLLQDRRAGHQKPALARSDIEDALMLAKGAEI
jgi:hypothetical protein